MACGTWYQQPMLATEQSFHGSDKTAEDTGHRSPLSRPGQLHISAGCSQSPASVCRPNELSPDRMTPPKLVRFRVVGLSGPEANQAIWFGASRLLHIVKQLS